MLIHRYLRKQILQICLSFTLVPILIVWLTQARPIIDMVIENGISLFIFLKLSLLLVPSLLFHILPFTFALSGLYLLYKLNQDNEMPILWASSVKPINLAHFFLKYGLYFSLLIFAINAYIQPKAEQTAKKEIFLIKNDLAKNLLKSSSFISPSQDIKLYIQSIKAGTQIEGFFLLDKTDPKIERIFTAEQAALINDETGDKILLLGGQIVMRPLDKETKPALLKFERFTLDLNSLNQADKTLPTTKNDDLTIFQLIEKTLSGNEIERADAIKQINLYIPPALEPLIYIMIVILGILYPISMRNFPIYRLFSILSVIIMAKLLITFLQDTAEHNIEYIYIVYIFVLAFLTSSYYYIKRL